MALKPVVFGVDGTLLDNQADIARAMVAAFDAVAMPPSDRARILSVVGLSLDRAVARLAPGAGAIGVTCGYHPVSEMNAELCLSHLQDLPDALSNR